MDHDSSMWSDSPTSVIKTSGGNALSGVITWSNRLPLRCVDVFTCCRKLYVDKIVLYLTGSGSRACSRLIFMSAVMVIGTDILASVVSSAENSSKNAVVVGCEPGQYTTTRMWLLPPEVIRQHIYSNVVVFCLSSILDKTTPFVATMAMPPWLTNLVFAWRRLSSRGLAVSNTFSPRPRRRLMVVQSESSCQVSVRASTCNFSSCISSLTSSILLLTDRMFRHPKRVKRLRCIACLEMRGQIRTCSLKFHWKVVT